MVLFSDEAGICFHMLMTVQEYLLFSDETGTCLSCADDGAGIFALF
jgi:hypothetical protein